MSDKSELVKAIPNILRGIKEFSKYLVIPCGLFILAPSSIISYINLLSVRDEYGKWVSIAFILFLSICLYDFVIFIYKIIKLNKQRNDLLSHLTDEDKSIITEINKVGSYMLHGINSSAFKLIQQDIIKVSSQGVAGYSSFQTVYLSLWVQKAIKTSPNILNR